jgi:large-conductance mechanosensitive channel
MNKFREFLMNKNVMCVALGLNIALGCLGAYLGDVNMVLIAGVSSAFLCVGLVRQDER